MPNVYKKILVAVDGSTQSTNALRKAIAIAKRNGSFLTVVTASNAVRFPATAHVVASILKQADISSRTIIADAHKIISDEVLYAAHMLNGNPKVVIVQYAEEEEMNLIVMGATGKGSVERALVGSTTAYVVNHAPCNVLVVR